MISLPQFPDSRILTHSSVGDFRLCDRKYLLAQLLGLRPAWDSEPLRVGHMFHLGVGLYESGIPIDEGLGAIREAYKTKECPPYLEPTAYELEEEISAAMVRGHYERWKNSGILETVAVELSFNLPIVNPATGRETPNFRQAGQIDRICRLPDGRLAHVERKTTGDSLDLNGDYWRKLTMDVQVSRYVLAARALGFDIATTIYDVQRKPAIRPKEITKADRALATSRGHYFGVELHAACPERETPKLFAARFLNDMRERPEFYFQRAEVPRLQSDLEEFEAEQWQLQRTIRAAEQDLEKFGKAAFPRNTNACTFPYKCAYFAICTGQTESPFEGAIPQGFRRVARLHEELKQGETDGSETRNAAATSGATASAA